MKINLPDVTLVMADTRCHDLARLAVQDCIEQVNFGDILICSNKDLKISGVMNYCLVNDWPDKDSAQEFLWHDIPSMINTSHFLFCEWDAWVLDSGQWTDDFLEYDYIGAPWSWLSERAVGNGGFSLHSTEMARYVAKHSEEFPVTHPFVWDLLLCREYRPKLEEAGFRFASQPIARQFSFETRHDRLNTFGFHALYNWPLVLSGKRLQDRIRMAWENEHVRKTQYQHLVKLAC